MGFQLEGGIQASQKLASMVRVKPEGQNRGIPRAWFTSSEADEKGSGLPTESDLSLRILPASLNGTGA